MTKRSLTDIDDSISIAICSRRLDILKFLLDNLDDEKIFRYNFYMSLTEGIYKYNLRKSNFGDIGVIKQMESMIESYNEFREKKEDRLKKISSELDTNLEEIMPKELIGIIKQYSNNETFEDYLNSINFITVPNL